MRIQYYILAFVRNTNSIIENILVSLGASSGGGRRDLWDFIHWHLKLWKRTVTCRFLRKYRVGPCRDATMQKHTRTRDSWDTAT